MPSIRETLETNRARGQTSMGIFVTCGFPTTADTVPLLRAIDRAGADFIELGMPFSDPLAEGGPIQYSSEIALRNGVSLRTVLDAASEFTGTSDTPLLLMGYFNPILQYGISNFCRDARSAGVGGLIVPDLPPGEASELFAAAGDNELQVVLLVAPNTADERMQMIDSQTTGFVYAVSVTGVTGSDLSSVSRVNDYLKRARTHVTKNPLLVGFGIRSADDAARLVSHTDGFIVGSALITRIRELWASGEDTSRRLESVESFVSALRPHEPA